MSGCLVKATFGQLSSRNREYCSSHKKSGMVDVHHQMCLVAGCTIQARFGFEGRCRKFCFDHKMPAMMSLDECLRRKCAKDGCEKQCVGRLFLAAVLAELAAKTRRETPSPASCGRSKICDIYLQIQTLPVLCTRPRHTYGGTHQPSPVFVTRTILSFPPRELTKRRFHKAPTQIACALEVNHARGFMVLAGPFLRPVWRNKKARRELTQRYPFRLTQTKNLQPYQIQNKQVDNSSQPGPNQKTTTRVVFQKGFLVGWF